MSVHLHPEWDSSEHSSGDGERIAIDIESEATPDILQATEEKTISRKPAAVVGMLIVAAVFFVSIQGLDSLTGSVGSESATIRIGSAGFIPSSIEVSQGTTIEWTNEAEAPHILESETLCDAEGACLYTPMILQGETVSFDVLSNIPPGTYTYNSAILPDIVGEIIVQGNEVEPITDTMEASHNTPATNNETQDVTEPSAEDSLTEATNEVETEVEPEPEAHGIESLFPNASNTPEPASTVTPAPTPSRSPSLTSQAIPTNPNVVGTVHNAAPAAIRAPATNPQSLHNGAPRPMRQPETGAGVWAVLAMSLCGFWLVTKRMIVQK